MSAVQGKHWPAGTPFVGGKPGDFIFNDEAVTAEPGDIVKWLRFGCPRGRGACTVPILPQRTSKGAGWKWDGNRDAPTLEPSINCVASEKYAGCGWHGHLKGGVFEEA